MQGYRFDPWSGKTPRAKEQLSPSAAAPEPGSRAWELQLLHPCRAVRPDQRRPRREGPCTPVESSPLATAKTQHSRILWISKKKAWWEWHLECSIWFWLGPWIRILSKFNCHCISQWIKANFLIFITVLWLSQCMSFIKNTHTEVFKKKESPCV